MGHPSVISRTPLLRVLAPYVAGILLHEVCPRWWPPLALIALAVIGGWVLGRVSSTTPSRRLRMRPYLALPLLVVALALGWLAAVIHHPPVLDAELRHSGNRVGQILDLDHTDFSTRLTVRLLDVPSATMPCRVLVTTRGCDYTLSPGDVITWPADLEPIRSRGNPGEMDYVSYMLHDQGIRYCQHLPGRDVQVLGRSPSLSTRMAALRRGLASNVYATSLSAEAQRLVVTLLLGQRGAIDPETRQQFSTAGVAHVLALSGLHVGLVALMLWWLLFPLDYIGLRRLRLVITLAAVGLFACFTGLSPSVVRSTVMTGTVLVAMALYRRSDPFNALLLAALAILVWSPSAIFGVGFQLSFVTVGSLLLVNRLPVAAIRTPYRWANYLISLVVASLTALLATLALTAHYFHTVSTLSVVTNVLVLPAMPLLMVLGALTVLTAAAGLQWSLLQGALDGLSGYVSRAIGWVNAIPHAYAGGVYVSTTAVVLYFVVLALVIGWFYSRRRRCLIGAAVALAMLAGHSLWVDAHTRRQGLVIFNSPTATPLLYYHNGEAMVWVPDEASRAVDSAAFVRSYSGFLARHGIRRLRFVDNAADGTATLRLGGARFEPPRVYVPGRRLVVASSRSPKTAPGDTVRVENVDDLIVTRTCHGRVAAWGQRYRFGRVILSGALHDASKQISECDSLHIHYHDLSASGAIELP